MTRKVKEILKLVAESPYYTARFGLTSSPYMCHSLNIANSYKLISEEEKRLASKAIKKYLNKLSNNRKCLSTALEDNNLPFSFVYLKAIYLDWKNRPKPWKRNENCSDS